MATGRPLLTGAVCRCCQGL